MTTTLSTTIANARSWIRGGHHAFREHSPSTPDELEATKTLIRTTAFKGHEKKTPHLPLLYTRNEEGKWEATTPLGGDAKIQGQLKARATLTLGKMNQIDRMRAKLEARKNV
jgi:hypothetical protein